MDKLIAILETALPVFLALGLGMICRKTGFLDRKGIDTLKKVVINLTLPAVLLNAFATAEYSAGTLVLPVLVHGLYLFICSYETPLAKALFYLLLLALYAVCFTAVNRLSDADGAVLGAAKAGLRKAHPQWAAFSAEVAEKGGEADEQ